MSHQVGWKVVDGFLGSPPSVDPNYCRWGRDPLGEGPSCGGRRVQYGEGSTGVDILPLLF